MQFQQHSISLNRASSPPGASDRLPSLARVQWDYIQIVLGNCKGNISETARRLRVHRKTLKRKLTKQPPLV